jgi:hypothetical protein
MKSLWFWDEWQQILAYRAYECRVAFCPWPESHFLKPLFYSNLAMAVDVIENGWGSGSKRWSSQA